MYETEVTFDRVFDIERLTSRGRTRTKFGFDAAGRIYEGIVIEGWPEITAGQTVTALLNEPGNWDTLQGWLCHDTGTIAGPRQITVRTLLAWILTINLFAFPALVIGIFYFVSGRAMPMTLFAALLANLGANALILIAAHRAGRVANRLEPHVQKLRPRHSRRPSRDGDDYVATMTKLWKS